VQNHEQDGTIPIVGFDASILVLIIEAAANAELL